MKFDLKNLKVRKPSSIQGWKGGTQNYMNPTRDWTVGIGIATVLFLGGSVLIGFDFYKQFGAPARDVVTEIQPVVYQEKEVVRYAEIYDERESAFNTLRKGRVYTAPPDALESDGATTTPETETHRE